MASLFVDGKFAPNLIVSIFGLFIATTGYTIFLTVYRLYFSPISHIPGPKLAAATWWYEFYYQVIKGGQFFKEVARLHEQYGKDSAIFYKIPH